MKISSQLANNFDYCSAEFGESFDQNALLCALSASALKTVADPSFGGSAVQAPSPSSLRTGIGRGYLHGNLKTVFKKDILA